MQRKRNGPGCDWIQDPGVNAAGAPVGSRRSTKKSKSDDRSTVTTGHAKVYFVNHIPIVWIHT